MEEEKDFKHITTILGMEGLGHLNELKKLLEGNSEVQSHLSKIEFCLDIILRNTKT